MDITSSFTLNHGVTRMSTSSYQRLPIQYKKSQSLDFCLTWFCFTHSLLTQHWQVGPNAFLAIRLYNSPKTILPLNSPGPAPVLLQTHVDQWRIYYAIM